jgi:hypothetical protein
MIRKSLTLGSCGALAIGLLAAAAQAAPGQVITLNKSAQTNNLLTPIHRGGGGWGGGRGWGGGGHWGGGHWGGGRGFAYGGWGGGRRFYRGYGFGVPYYGYGYTGCFWYYGRWVCPGYGGYGGYPYY